MAVLSAQALPLGGLQPTYASAASGGDQAPVGDKLFLHVRNGGGSSITVTVATPGTVGGLDISDAQQTVPASGAAFVPLTATFRDPMTGRAAISYSGTTTVTVAVLRLP
ncbi:hypothetical protein JBE04_08400 [Streptomyces sp. PRKS01-29]|uniref:hypothetical protein n=1 Tax=Streptomyces antimycoticus TaxID=68175 RepID=UPI0018DD441E|nr:hypothetical protein [Streptomyces sabulosicollis]MBI0294502.1 hypothetical protein [Streptomyces sabulosicollis]